MMKVLTSVITITGILAGMNLPANNISSAEQKNINDVMKNSYTELCASEQESDSHSEIVGDDPDTWAPQEVDTKEELEESVGFEMAELSELPFPDTSVTYVSLWGKAAEILYYGDENTICLRKSEEWTDISGDYTEYEQVDEIEFLDYSITVKSDSDGYYVCQWTDGISNWSLTSEQGLSGEELMHLFTDIMEHETTQEELLND